MLIRLIDQSAGDVMFSSCKLRLHVTLVTLQVIYWLHDFTRLHKIFVVECPKISMFVYN
jgi:hypothetical protein